MNLRQKQSAFLKATVQLMSHAHYLGYELTYGDTWAFDFWYCMDAVLKALPNVLKKQFLGRRHMKGSKHYKRLAIDLNLFKNGRYCRSSNAHEPLGLFWESIGGIWGGRYKDGNHYEWPED